MTRMKSERRHVEYYEWLALGIEGLTAWGSTRRSGYNLPSQVVLLNTKDLQKIYIYEGQPVTINALL